MVCGQSQALEILPPWRWCSFNCTEIWPLGTPKTWFPYFVLESLDRRTWRHPSYSIWHVCGAALPFILERKYGCGSSYDVLLAMRVIFDSFFFSEIMWRIIVRATSYKMTPYVYRPNLYSVTFYVSSLLWFIYQRKYRMIFCSYIAISICRTSIQNIN